jgi:hypothetical protein
MVGKVCAATVERTRRKLKRTTTLGAIYSGLPRYASKERAFSWWSRPHLTWTGDPVPAFFTLESRGSLGHRSPGRSVDTDHPPKGAAWASREHISAGLSFSLGSMFHVMLGRS